MSDSRGAARRLAGASAVAAMVAGMMGLGLVGAGPAAAAVPAVQVASATTGLSDAQAVVLTGSGLTVGEFSPVWVTECVGDVPDKPDGLKGTVTVGGGHVVGKSVGLCSAKEAFSKTDNAGVLWRVPTVPGGSFRIRFWVRQGEMKYQLQDNAGVFFDHSINCDAESDCRIVVFQGAALSTDVTVLKSIPISFAPDAQVACGLATDGSVTAAGPVSMQDTVNLWAGASCATGKANPLLLDYTQAGEQAGLQAFQAGQGDVAVSGTGFAPPGGNVLKETRKAVFTPVAVQGAVVAIQGGYNIQDTVDVALRGQTPIEDLSMTVAEVATLFGKGGLPLSHTEADEAPVVARNPDLVRARDFRVGDRVVITANGAVATADATTLALTTAFTQSRSPAWKSGIRAAFPPDVNPPQQSVPLSSNFPAFRLQVLGSVLNDQNEYLNGLRLYLTDSATAAKLGLPVVKLQNAAGKFVAPSEPSLAAAVKGMTRNADGTLSANPKNPDPAAYPLPVVQYAISPAAKMVDTGRRDRLVTFLKYAVGAGQQAMTGGNYPLPSTLKAEADASLARIGATVPVKIPPRTPAPPAPTSAGPLPPANVGTPPGLSDTTGTGGAGGTGDSATGAGAGRTTPSAAPKATDAAGPQRLQAARPGAARSVTDSVSIPVFPGLRATALGRAGPVLGLVALVGLLSLAAFVTSGRSAGPLAARIRRRLPPRFAHRRS